MAKEWNGSTLVNFSSDLQSEDRQSYLRDKENKRELSPVHKRRRKKKILAVFTLILLSGIVSGGFFLYQYNEKLDKEYTAAWTAYQQIAQDKNRALDDAQGLANDCYTQLEDTSLCSTLTSAIDNVNQGWEDIETPKKNRSTIEQLTKVNGNTTKALKKLSSTVSTVEENMEHIVVDTLNHSIEETRTQVEQATTIYSESEGKVDDDKLREPLKRLLTRVSSSLSKAEKMLDTSKTALSAQTTVTQARSMVKILQSYSEDFEEEENTLHEAEAAYQEKKRAEEAARLQRRQRQNVSPPVSIPNPPVPSPIPSTAPTKTTAPTPTRTTTPSKSSTSASRTPTSKPSTKATSTPTKK